MTTTQMYTCINKFLATLDRFDIGCFEKDGKNFRIETWELYDYWVEARKK